MVSLSEYWFNDCVICALPLSSFSFRNLSNAKLEAFGCAKKNISGPMLKDTQSHINLTYLNNDEHTHLDKRTGNTDIIDMAFISPNLTKHDIQFLIGDDLGSDHLPIKISIDAQHHRNIHTNPIRYKFDQTDREVFESTLEAALSSGDVPELKSTQDIHKYADFIVTAVRETQIYPQVKFLWITFDSKFTFQKHQVSPNQTVSQQKMGTQPVHHMTNLQIMCPTSFRIWLPFDHNSIGHDRQQNSKGP